MTDYKIDVDYLKEICPIYNQAAQSNIKNRYAVSEYDANMLQLKENYIMQVEVGNRLIGNILKAEKEYFEEKYGEKLYDFLKEKRDDFMKKNIASDCNSMRQYIKGDEILKIEKADVGNLVSELKNDLSNNLDIYDKFQNSTYINTMRDISKQTDILNDAVSELYSKNSVNQRKIEYREEELKKVDKINGWITILYYIIVFVYFLYLISIDKLNLMSNLVYYVIVILFPIFIYPFIFKNIKKLFAYLSLNMEIHGPKNAFLNTEIDLDFIDNHDI